MLTQYFPHMQFVNRPSKRNFLTSKTSNMENVKTRFTLWIHFLILIASNYFNVFRLQKITNVCYHGNLGTEVLRHRQLLFNPGHNWPTQEIQVKIICCWHTYTSLIYLTLSLHSLHYPFTH